VLGERGVEIHIVILHLLAEMALDDISPAPKVWRQVMYEIALGFCFLSAGLTNGIILIHKS
jgi:hypothetical protein